MLAGGLGGLRVLKGRGAVCPYTLDEDAYTRLISCVYVCVCVLGYTLLIARKYRK